MIAGRLCRAIAEFQPPGTSPGECRGESHDHDSVAPADTLFRRRTALRASNDAASWQTLGDINRVLIEILDWFVVGRAWPAAPRNQM
jgi:hypothetical protein